MASTSKHLRLLLRAQEDLRKLVGQEQARLDDPAPGARTVGVPSALPCPACGKLVAIEREVYYEDYEEDEEDEEDCEHCGVRLSVLAALVPVVLTADVDTSGYNEPCSYCGKDRDPCDGTLEALRCRCLTR